MIAKMTMNELTASLTGARTLNKVCESGVAANECFSAPSAPKTANDQNGASAALSVRESDIKKYRKTPSKM